MKWNALVLVAYLGLPLCFSLVKRIRPQEYLAIQSSCEKWFIIFINSWCWNTLLIDDFVFRLRSLLYNLEGIANIGVIDGVADAAFYHLLGYGGMQFVQLIDPPCSDAALLRNGNLRHLLPYFDAQKITRELISLVSNYEQDACKLQKYAIQEKIDTTAIFDSCYFWVVFETSKLYQSTYDQCYNDYVQLARHFEGDYRFAFIPTTKQVQGCLVSVYGLNKQQPTRFNLVSNGMAALYGVPSFLDEYRSRYRPCSTNPWEPVDMYTVMASCKFWIVASVVQDSDWPCVREIEKFAVYSKDNFEFGYVKGPTFGVWLFLENKLNPVLAISDSATCNVPAVFDIIKGQLNKVPPPTGKICDNYPGSSVFDVDEPISILNQKRLMGSWENWIVLQSSPFSSNYRELYTKFKYLANQFKGSVRFGFTPSTQFGLWLYGSDKNWPYLITSDPNDFQPEKYISIILDLLSGRRVESVATNSMNPYLGTPQNVVANIQPQIPMPVSYYPSIGAQITGRPPQVDLYGSRGLSDSDNHNSNALLNVISTTTTAPISSKPTNVFKQTVVSADNDASNEYILEPILNLAKFPDKWKAGLDELFSNSRDLVVRVSFPNPKGWNKVEAKDQVKPKSDGATIVEALHVQLPVGKTPQTTTSTERVIVPYLDGARSSVQLDSYKETATHVTDLPMHSATVADVTLSSEAKKVLETSTASVSELVESVIAENRTEVVPIDMNSLPQPEPTILTAERSIGESEPQEPITESNISMDAVTLSTEPVIVDSETPASVTSEDEVTEALETLTTEEIKNDASGARDIGEEPNVGIEAETTTEITTTSELTTESTTETTTESTTESTPVSTTETSTESTSTVSISEPISEITSETTTVTTTVSTTESTTLETTTPPKSIETTDVETVRKDCKFWVLISSTGSKENEEQYEKCYRTLTTVMDDYKGIYKFGAVQTGEFFINLYLRNKSNPILIASDLACDEKKIRSVLDAHKTENPGEFCQDPEDGPDLPATTTELVTTQTTPQEPITSTVAPDCSLQLVVRYPKREAKKYQSCVSELTKVINSKQTKWQLKEEDKPAFAVLVWTTSGIKPLMNFKVTDCKVNAIEKAINKVITLNTAACAYSRG